MHPIWGSSLAFYSLAWESWADCFISLRFTFLIYKMEMMITYMCHLPIFIFIFLSMNSCTLFKIVFQYLLSLSISIFSPNFDSAHSLLYFYLGGFWRPEILQITSPLLRHHEVLNHYQVQTFEVAHKTLGVLSLLTPLSCAVPTPLLINFTLCFAMFKPFRSLARTGLSLPAGRFAGVPSTPVSLALA